MSKKKKLAGKKTKLAKLALTQVLSQGAGAPASSGEPISAVATSFSQALEALQSRQMELELSFLDSPGSFPPGEAHASYSYSYVYLLQHLSLLRNLFTYEQLDPLLPQEASFRVAARTPPAHLKKLVEDIKKSLREIKLLMED